MKILFIQCLAEGFLDLLSHQNGLLPFRELDRFDTLPVHQATRELMASHFCETVSVRIEPR